MGRRATKPAVTPSEPVVGSWELPEGWEWQRLDDAAPINPRRPLDDLADDDEITFVPMASVEAESGRIDVSTTRPAKLVRQGFTRFAPGDVIFAKITPCMENGKIAVVPEIPHGLGCGSTEFHVLAARTVLPKYLYYWVSQRSFRETAEFNMAGTAGQKRVPSAFMRESVIPVPPITTQERIVARIDELFAELDDAGEAMARAGEDLGVWRKTLMKAAVTGELTANWRANNPMIETGADLLARILIDRRTDSKNARKTYKEPLPPRESLIGLPDHWAVATLEQLTSKIVDGTHHTPTYVDDGVPFLSVKDIRQGVLFFDSCRHISLEEHNTLSKRCRPEKGDLLVTKSGTIGRTAVIATDQPFSLFVSVALLKPASDEISGDWLEFAFHYWFRTADVAQDVKGTAIKNLHLEDFREIIVPLPPKEEQEAIMAEFKSLGSQSPADDIEEVGSSCELLRQSILAAAFRGDLV